MLVTERNNGDCECDLLWLCLCGTFVQTRRRVVLGGDDGFEVIAFPSLLLTVAVCGESGSGRNLLRLIDGGLFQIGAVHHRKGGGVCSQQSVGVDSDWSLCRASFRSGRNGEDC